LPSVFWRRCTFIALQVEYNGLFDNSDQFDDGAFFYALGVGFNF
jgi:hypothetical protein